MKRSSRRLCLWYVAVCALTLLCALLRSVALLTAFDVHPGYFRTAPITVIYYVVMALALLCAASLPLWIKKEALPTAAPAPTLPGLCGAGIVALLFLVNFIEACFSGGDSKLPAGLWIFGLLALLVATVYFALRFLAEKPPLSATLLCGYGTILAAALLLCFTYFDPFTPMNAPHKMSLHLSLLSVMVYLFYDLRTLAGEGMPRAATASAGVAFLLALTTGSSKLLAFVAGTYHSVPYLVQDLLLLGLAVYIGATGAARARRDVQVLAKAEAAEVQHECQ